MPGGGVFLSPLISFFSRVLRPDRSSSLAATGVAPLSIGFDGAGEAAEEGSAELVISMCYERKHACKVLAESLEL